MWPVFKFRKYDSVDIVQVDDAFMNYDNNIFRNNVYFGV